MSEGIYFIELFTENYARRFKVENLLYRGKTKHQLVHCFHNQYLGKVLFLDKKIQSAQVDEFIYHESLVHPVLFTHPSPSEVLVIGGGEGATIREVLRHKTVKKVTMVDIDGIEGAAVGDEVALFGRQGEAEIAVDDVASRIGTINYEVICGIGKRVARVYLRGGEPIGLRTLTERRAVGRRGWNAGEELTDVRRAESRRESEPS